MFFKLILENANGNRIDMTTTANEYMTSNIEGLNPPVGTISTSSYAGMDGSYLNNAFIEKRNVVIHFDMRGPGVEQRRHQLYKVVKPSGYIKIYYATACIDVFTEGYVESCEVSNFEQLVTGQISILCPDIYWYSTESVMAYYSQITGVFTFPFPTESNPEPFVLGKYNRDNTMTIVNEGDETGFTLVIEALDDARSPTLYNADTVYDNSGTPISTKEVDLRKGSKISLMNTPLYTSADAKEPSNTVNGTYFIYDGLNFNGRMRITNAPEKCGNTPVGFYVTGYISIDEL